MSEVKIAFLENNEKHLHRVLWLIYHIKNIYIYV